MPWICTMIVQCIVSQCHHHACELAGTALVHGTPHAPDGYNAVKDGRVRALLLI
jgi:hypothetical protein